MSHSHETHKSADRSIFTGTYSSSSSSSSSHIILILPDSSIYCIGNLIASDAFNSTSFVTLEKHIRDITSHKEVEKKFRKLVKVKRSPVKQLIASPSVQKYSYHRSVKLIGRIIKDDENDDDESYKRCKVSQDDDKFLQQVLLDDNNDHDDEKEETKVNDNQCTKSSPSDLCHLLLSVIDRIQFVYQCHSDDKQSTRIDVNDDDLICKENTIYQRLESILTQVTRGNEITKQIAYVDDHLSSSLSSSLSENGELYTEDETVIKNIISGALTNYKESIKLSIVNYLLLSKQTAKSVRLPVTRRKHPDKQFVKDKCVLSEGLTFIITPSVPWHTSVTEAVNICDTNLLKITSLINDIRTNWYQLFSFDNLNVFNDISYPCNVQYFTSKISINLSLIRATLIYEWISSVANMFNEYIHINNINNSIEQLNLCNVIYSFMCRLLRQFIIETIEKWVTIVINKNINQLHCELFVARADYLKGTGCHLDPSPDTWPWLLEYPIEQILSSFQHIPRIESHLTTLIDDIFHENSNKYLLSIDKSTDWQIKHLLEMIGTSIASGITNDTILHTLDESINSIEVFKQKSLVTYDIQRFRNLLAKQSLFEKQLILSEEKKIQSNQSSGLVLINYNELRQKILIEAENTRNSVIKSRVLNIINLGHQLCSILNDIKVTIETVTESTEEIVNSIKSMNDYRMLVRCIFKDIEFIEDHWNFLTQEGCLFLSDTDYELMHNLYNWPNIIRATFIIVDERLGASKVRKENRLRNRIESFNIMLDQLINELIYFNKKRLSSPLEKMNENVKLLENMEETIESALKMKLEINLEEGLLGWPLQTKFPQLDIIRSFKYPVDLLWQTADEFDIKSNKWLNLRIREIDIPRINQNLNRLKEKIKNMNNGLEEAIKLHENKIDGIDEVKSSIHLLESRIVDFEKIKIPLLTVLIMPELREKHLAEVADILERDDLTLNNLTTLTDISNITIDIDKVTQIQNIGKNALREHELEVFLSRMKNEWISDDEWPTDALNIAAGKFLQEESLSKSIKEQCVSIFKLIHDSARKFVSGSILIDKKYKEMNDLLPTFKLHFTPPSFVELILTFKQLLRKKQIQIYNRKHRYKGGVEKLDMAGKFVFHMKKKLIEEDNPKLEQMSGETENLMVTIEEETIQVEWRKEKIACDEGLANAAAALAQQIRDECTKELAAAVPAVESAIKALDTIVPEDIVFLRTMKNPPLGLKMVLESVAVLLEYTPEKKINSHGIQFDDYWSSALKMLNSSEVTLLEALKSFDKDHIDSQSMTLLRQCYLCYDDFDPIALRNVSIASESLAKWVKAIDIYDRVINVIKPKKARLLQAEQELITLVDKVYTKKTELQVITDKLQGLSDRFAAVSKEKKELEENIIESGLKLERAEKLLTGLESEKKRWAKASEQLTILETTLIGDALLSAACIVYLSGIPTGGRRILTEMWLQYIIENTDIKCSEPFKLFEAAATRLQIQTWIVAGLPIEQFYLDNATILTNSRRYCFIIDPYEIASDFIKKYHTLKGLTLISRDDSITPTVYIQIRKNITRGKPVVLEDVTREKLMDPFIQSILIKDIDESTSGSAYITLSPSQEELEYNKNFNLYMITKEYFELPRDIYSRICIINWIDESFNSMERKAHLEQAIEYQERAKKERQLLELEDKLLEKLAYGLNTLDNEDAIGLLVQYKNLASQIHQQEEPSTLAQESG